MGNTTKRNYNYMNNERGFIFPFTLVTVTIIFLVLTTLVSRFEREIVMTNNLQNQFIIESLFSLATNHKETNLFKEETLPNRKTYDFPQGKVTISYTPFDEYFQIQFLIDTTNGKQYTIYQSHFWKESQDEIDEKNNKIINYEHFK